MAKVKTNSDVKKKVHLKNKDSEKEILTENSRSLLSWNNVPRFHMDRMLGKSDKEKRQERLEKILKKRKQRGIESYLDSDRCISKADHFDKQNDELSKIKNRN